MYRKVKTQKRNEIDITHWVRGLNTNIVDIVTYRKNCFIAMLVLRQEREFYGGFFTGGQVNEPRPWRPFLRHMRQNEASINARVIVLSLLGMEILRNFEKILCDVMPCRKSYKYRGAQTTSPGSRGTADGDIWRSLDKNSLPLDFGFFPGCLLLVAKGQFPHPR
ncbi:hypothetical protein AVEN_76595-1 [Araneus ventricosus]|uniref:Uncharacterized protein n=1 Tax=Araneus ventricosus TaxID=182803 RepID=A0A4Y2MIJ8_ARAVE|nr:hypothetical protein AVEN_76595-1 [Araneus ventricosus]